MTACIVPVASPASRDPDDWQSWHAYCRTDPEGALESLLREHDALANAQLWSSFFSAAVGPPDGDEVAKDKSRQLLERAFAHLVPVEEAFLRATTYPLVEGFISGRRLGAKFRANWWDRLWTVVEADLLQEEDDIGGDRFYSRVISSTAGRLTEDLLLKIDKQRLSGQRISRRGLARLERVFRSETYAGHLGRGECAKALEFVRLFDASRADRYLKPRFFAEGVEGAALRAVMVEFADLGADATRVMKDPIIRGVEERIATGTAAARVAAKIIWPIMESIRTGTTVDCGFTAPEVRRVLTRARDGVRQGAVVCLSSWMANSRETERSFGGR